MKYQKRFIYSDIMLNIFLKYAHMHLENEALRFSPQNYDHFEDKKKLSFLLNYVYVKGKRKDIY